MWWGGFAVGPRYLLPALPFMVVPLAVVFERWGSAPAFKAAAGGLAAWSFLATWGLTLAEQAFPSDSLRSPLLEHALPHWQTGNIARNVGTILGFEGAWSLVPLALLLVGIGLTWYLLAFRQTAYSLAEKTSTLQGHE